MLYCLDTNIVIEIFRKNIEIAEKIKELEAQQVTMSLSPVVLCELFRGVYLAKNKTASLEQMQEFVAAIDIVEFSKNAAEIYGKKYAELQKHGKQTQEFDLMIASICIAHNAILITRNGKDFKHIKDLKYVVW